MPQLYKTSNSLLGAHLFLLETRFLQNIFIPPIQTAPIISSFNQQHAFYTPLLFLLRKRPSWNVAKNKPPLLSEKKTNLCFLVAGGTHILFSLSSSPHVTYRLTTLINFRRAYFFSCCLWRSTHHQHGTILSSCLL